MRDLEQQQDVSYVAVQNLQWTPRGEGREYMNKQRRFDKIMRPNYTIMSLFCHPGAEFSYDMNHFQAFRLTF